MCRSDDSAVPLYGFLKLQKPVKASVDRKTGELPFDDSGKPYEGAHIVETDSAIGFLRLQILETVAQEPRLLFLQIFIREILKSLPATVRLNIEAIVPECSKRSTCTLSTLINLNAGLMTVSS